jgi:uracil-DNA glycosylase
MKMTASGLREIHLEIAACRACPNMVGPPVHGPAVQSPIFLLGQAPGPHEGRLGRPFAYTAGKTLFRWFEETSGVNEAMFRDHVYMAAVARCFPGKAPGGADRVPDTDEIKQCSGFIARELAVLKPKLILAVGKLAMSQVLGPEIVTASTVLTALVGKPFTASCHGHKAEVICLPHPSGVSSWPKKEPGKGLLAKALEMVRTHPEWRAVFSQLKRS